MELQNKEFWEEFIDCYRMHVCLWDVKSKDYSNKIKRNGAYEEPLKNYASVIRKLMNSSNVLNKAVSILK